MAVLCPSCGARNGDDETSCSLCGTSFAAYEPTKTGPVPAGANAEPTATGSLPEVDMRGVIVGVRVANRYRVDELLGRGGVAMVFRALDETLGDEIALKVFPNLTRQSSADLDRFKREVLVNRRISHPNVIRVHDFGTVGDDAYLTMELLRGGTLAQRIEEKLLPIAQAVEIAIGICDGLHAAHQAGIVHRDVKPENVLFDDAGRAKLVDFGLARLLDASTHTRGFSGTPFYMSPEQADGGEITPQTDVYSLGVLLFELLTGQLPFFADSLVRIALLHTKEPPPRPSSLRPGLPPALERLVLACLAKKPAERPAGAAAVATELRAFRDVGGVAQARQLDERPTPAAPRPRPRMAGSERVVLGASAAETVPPERSPETVITRPPPSPGGRAPAPGAAAAETAAARERTAVAAAAEPAAARERTAVAVSAETAAARERTAVSSGSRDAAPRQDAGASRGGGAAAARRPSPPVFELDAAPAPRRRSALPIFVAVAIAVAGTAAGAYRVYGPGAVASGSPTPLSRVSETPAESPVRTADATPTAVAVATQSKAPPPTPVPTPRHVATPRATPTRVAVARTPPPATPADRRPGQLNVSIKPWAVVWVDGEKLTELGVVTRSLPPGTRRVRVQNTPAGFDRTYEVEIRPGTETRFSVNLRTGAVKESHQSL